MIIVADVTTVLNKDITKTVRLKGSQTDLAEKITLMSRDRVVKKIQVISRLETLEKGMLVRIKSDTPLVPMRIGIISKTIDEFIYEIDGRWQVSKDEFTVVQPRNVGSVVRVRSDLRETSPVPFGVNARMASCAGKEMVISHVEGVRNGNTYGNTYIENLHSYQLEGSSYHWNELMFEEG